MKYFIANWKANKNLKEGAEWIDKFLTLPIHSDRIKVVICPPHPLIYPLKQKLPTNTSISLGSQDLSTFESGSYTGEVTAKSLRGLVDFTIIGHSERRKYFNENDEVLFRKTQLAKQYNIEPIYCVRDEKDKIPYGVKIIAYEPVYAIGSGFNEPIEKVLEMKQKIHLPPQTALLYGGSIDQNNADSYLSSAEIGGLLVGNASLDPREFFEIVKLSLK